jgi:hypothetical protein
MELKYVICVGLCVGLAEFATAMVDTPPQRLKKLINDGKCHLVSIIDRQNKKKVSLFFSVAREIHTRREERYILQRREIHLAERYIHSTH